MSQEIDLELQFISNRIRRDAGALARRAGNVITKSGTNRFAARAWQLRDSDIGYAEDPLAGKLTPFKDQQIASSFGGRSSRTSLHAERAPLRRVESVRDELQLGDHLLAHERLAPAAELVAHLLPVDVGLEELLIAPAARIGIGAFWFTDVVRLPGATSSSAIQLRPSAGSSENCFGSMLPAGLVCVTLTSGASAVTVTFPAVSPAASAPGCSRSARPAASPARGRIGSPGAR